MTVNQKIKLCLNLFKNLINKMQKSSSVKYNFNNCVTYSFHIEQAESSASHLMQINHLQTELWKEKQKSNEIQAKLREEILLRSHHQHHSL